MYAMEIDGNSDSRLANFIGLSVTVHFAAFAYILLMKIVVPEIKPEPVEIEIIPPKGQKVIAPLIYEKKLPEVRIPQPAIKTKIEKVQRSKVRIKTNISSIPALEISDLDVSKQIEVESLSEDALAEDFEQIDKESQMKMDAARKSMVRAHKQALLTHEESLSEIELQAQREAERMATHSRAKRKGELAALAESQGKISGEDNEKTAVNRQGSAGSPAQDKYGIPKGVRALEDIRQRPGNRKPMYDYQDRLAGRQGEIVFIAYISKEGKPVQFKMVKSTGHSELDEKTLKALKQWRFYPGQEGWVEIPFRWDLKGGPQEMPATLRRKISVFITKKNFFRLC